MTSGNTAKRPNLASKENTMTDTTLTADYLAAIRSAASELMEDSLIRVQSRGIGRTAAGYVITAEQASLTDTDDRDTVRRLCTTDTLSGAEAIRTLLQAVPHLLAEIERLNALADAHDDTHDGTVDSENGFGALMRVDWTCDTRLTSTGWHAELTYAEQR